jgi:uroporphyrinogen-III decarboxylase
MNPTDKEWAQLTPEQKRQQRFEWALETPPINFVSPDAEKAYKIRRKRLVDTYQMKEPDRVLVQQPFGILPLKWAGLTLKTAMYNADVACQIWKKLIYDFEMDTYSGPAVTQGKVYDMIDYKLYKWPGHGLPDDASGLQFVEGEYITADEYADLIRDPSDFWLRTYIPRVMTIFEPFHHLRAPTSMIEIATGYLTPYSRPDVQKSLLALIDVGNEILKFQQITAECTREAREAGIPGGIGGSGARAPFDTIGDTMRGTQGIMMDMFRCPDELHKAMDVIADVTIHNAITTANAARGLTVGFPLHKGADGFMSDKQFETFYWPSLRKVCLALIDEGLMPSLFAEGSYTTRLETVNEFPKGAIIWRFDKTDMARAKKVLGDKCCITGNVPASLISTGTAGEVKEYCRHLIEICAPGGGYILSAGSSVTSAPPENLRAMMAAGKEYGVYR